MTNAGGGEEEEERGGTGHFLPQGEKLHLFSFPFFSFRHSQHMFNSNVHPCTSCQRVLISAVVGGGVGKQSVFLEHSGSDSEAAGL